MFLFLMGAVTLKVSKMYSGSVSWPQLFPIVLSMLKRPWATIFLKHSFHFPSQIPHASVCMCMCACACMYLSVCSLMFVCTFTCECAYVCAPMLVDARGSHWVSSVVAFCCFWEHRLALILEFTFVSNDWPESLMDPPFSASVMLRLLEQATTPCLFMWVSGLWSQFFILVW